MKFRKILSTVLAFTTLFSVSVFGSCDTPQSQNPQEQLHIIDDNNRNWYEVFVRSYFDSNNDGLGDLAGLESKWALTVFGSCLFVNHKPIINTTL